MNKKIFSLAIAMLCIQANITVPMATLQALKDSVLKDKGLAFVAAGAGVAAVTSLAAATYCLSKKIFYARQKAHKEMLTSEVQKAEKLVKENNALLKLRSITPSTKGSIHPFATPGKHYATLVREPSKDDDCKKVLDAWKKKLEAVEAPGNIKSEFDILREEIFEGGVPNEKEFIKARNKLINTQWFASFENNCNNADINLQDIRNSLSQAASEKQLARAKAHSWSKLVRGMGLGYLASASLMLYGYFQSKKV